MLLNTYSKFEGGGVDGLDEDIASNGEASEVSINGRESSEDLAMVLEHILLSNIEGDVGGGEAFGKHFYAKARN